MADMHTPLNCPFCGKEPILIKMVEDDDFDRWHKVMCEECGIEMGDEYRSEAIAAWNRRSPSQDAETIKALREALRERDCPRPCNARPDDFSTGDCVDAGECGCLTDAARAALAGSAS